jgi:endogenous inhibitor of DNA gyrase (YacG/DUF329 family)
MWVKKMENEFVRDRNRKLFLHIVAAVVAWIVLSSIMAMIPGWGEVGTHVNSLDDFIHRLPEKLILCSFIMIVLLWPDLPIGKNRRGLRTVVCPSCGKAVAGDETNICLCGGHYIDIDKMKWVVDDNESKSNVTDNTDGDS